MILGDLILIICPQDRNRGGGDKNNMLLFNSAIQAHDLEEIPLKGRTFTWSNMQEAGCATIGEIGLGFHPTRLDHTIPKYYGSSHVKTRFRSYSY